MKKSLAIFTFSPIQPFISEARRPSDLYAGSRILSDLATAATKVLQKNGRLVYPGSPGKDTPNKLVAILDSDTPEEILKNAPKVIIERWIRIAGEAKAFFSSITQSPITDPVWQKIWDRQIDQFPWEYYWIIQELDENLPIEDAYQVAYPIAEKGLNSVKRLRKFEISDSEPGQKDSLSGTRQALLTSNNTNSSEYWTWISKSPGISPAQIRPGERLDSIGLVKRFWPTDFQGQGFLGFPSTSSITSIIYLDKCIENYPAKLESYRQAVEKLGLFMVSNNHAWPYDGDYLYPDSLDHLIGCRDSELLEAKEALKRLHEVAGEPPTYFAIVKMDGDSMGQRINQAIKDENPIQKHMDFSNSISTFASEVPSILDFHKAFQVYAGGEDILFLSPVDSALDSALDLAEKFRGITAQTIPSTCSAGVAIVHHTSPLGAALRVASEAEHAAKEYRTLNREKDAICIRVIKRSSEELLVSAHWDDLRLYAFEILGWFRQGIVGSRFPSELKRSSLYLPANGPMVKSELNRLLKQHKEDNSLNTSQWAARLETWSQELPNGIEDVSNWVLLARFLVKGGNE